MNTAKNKWRGCCYRSAPRIANPENNCETVDNVSKLAVKRSLLAIALLTACPACKQTKPAAPPEPPPSEVTVALPTVEQVIDYREYTGRTAAIDSVEVRARVGGYLEKREFTEGSEVKEGDLLFRIDSRPVKEEIRQAEANLAAQKAQLVRFDLDLKRARDLIATNAISQADLDLAIANASSGSAQLNALEAALAGSKLNLQYTEIRSPITGRIGRALVTPGNLVVADTTVLTSVVSMNPMFAYFDVDESSALDYRARVRDSQVDSARSTRIEIGLGLANEEGHPHTGEIDFVDNVTDIGSGNITIRGRFDNQDGTLLPGLFVRIKVPFTRPYDALLVPQTALAMNQQGRYVLVVDKEDTVKPHVVTVGAMHGDKVAISSGIGPEDRVVIKGLQKAKPGSKVKPMVVATEASANSPTVQEDSTADSSTNATSSAKTKENTQR